MREITQRRNKTAQNGRFRISVGGCIETLNYIYRELGC